MAQGPSKAAARHAALVEACQSAEGRIAINRLIRQSDNVIDLRGRLFRAQLERIRLAALNTPIGTPGGAT